MNPSAIPASCSLALTAVLAAGISHWWSVQQFTTLVQNGVPVSTKPISQPEAMESDSVSGSTELANASAPNHALAKIQRRALSSHPLPAGQSNADQREFFAALVDKMNRVEEQNRDLLDQLAETNRDMMKLEFRVDSHSESFRPLPLVEDKPFSSIPSGSAIDDNPGVLPPRATPVELPSYE